MRSISPSHGTDYLRMLLYAYDILIFCRDISELESITNIVHNVFKKFGLTIAGDKTKTMVFNSSEEIASQPSLIKINGEIIENVRTFRCIVYVISNTDKTQFINSQIPSAHEKWSDLKSTLTDGEIKIRVRLKMLEACVRSRLLHAVQACRLSAQNMDKLEVIWMGFLRRIVKGGFKRQRGK